VSRWWPRRYRRRLIVLPPRAVPKQHSPFEQETDVPADPLKPFSGVDRQLAIAAKQLTAARKAGNAEEVARLTQWIDTRLDQRLKLAAE
jgi:hypothetical protein